MWLKMAWMAPSKPTATNEYMVLETWRKKVLDFCVGHNGYCIPENQKQKAKTSMSFSVPHGFCRHSPPDVSMAWLWPHPPSLALSVFSLSGNTCLNKNWWQGVCLRVSSKALALYYQTNGSLPAGFHKA